MKKLLLLGVIVVGAATVAQAGVRLNFGIGIPLPGVTYSAPPPVYAAPPPAFYQAPPAPVYQAPPPVVYQAPPPVVYSSQPVVYTPAPSLYFGFGSGWWHGHHWYGHHGWHR